MKEHNNIKNPNTIGNNRALVLRIPVIVVASVIFALNIKSFVRTGGLIPGGATGLTLLIQEVCARFMGLEVPYTPINVAINAIPVYIGFKYIGKRFTALSCLVIALTSMLTDLIPGYIVTQDILLISLFGGIINGIAVSLCLLMDATSGGTDFISIYLTKRKGLDGFNVSLGINAAILVITGALLGWDKALYSIIFQYTSTTVIHLLYRKYQETTLFIVTKDPNGISRLIFDMSRHGSTVLYGKGSYEEESTKSVVYSVVSATEANKLVTAIKEKDPESFVNVFKTERVAGRFYRIPEE